MGAICCHPLSGKEKLNVTTIKGVDMASELCQKTGFTVEELKKHFNDFMTVSILLSNILFAFKVYTYYLYIVLNKV